MAYLGDLRSAFILYCNSLRIYQAATKEREDLGPIPEFPAVVVIDSDYTDVVALRSAWTDDRNTIAPAISNYYTAISGCLYSMYVANNMVADTWAYLNAPTPGAFAPFGDDVWIGYAAPNLPLNTISPVLLFSTYPPTLIPPLIILEAQPDLSFKEWRACNQNPETPVDPITTPVTAPALTAAVGATVDNSYFDISAAGIPVVISWATAINDVLIGGVSLNASAWEIVSSPGVKLRLYPSRDTKLQSSGTKSVTVSCPLFTTASVSQPIGAGAATQLIVHTQPTAPANNGDALAQQPVIYIADQYGNTTTSTALVTAAVGDGEWILGGDNTKNGVAGIATFTDLDATSDEAVTGATIEFTAPSIESVTSATFNIPAP